eukprot:jgi/Bigna1/90794/estExt_fgenesh1_pg.C_790077
MWVSNGWQINGRFDDTAGTVERALSYFKDNNVKVVALGREAGQDIFNREGGDDAGAEARLKAKLDVPFSYWAWCLDRRAHFKAVFDRIVAAVPKGTAHVVKYSSLCFNPKQELDGIQQFLNTLSSLVMIMAMMNDEDGVRSITYVHVQKADNTPWRPFAASEGALRWQSRNMDSVFLMVYILVTELIKKRKKESRLRPNSTLRQRLITCKFALGSLHSMVRDWEATRTRLMKETHWGSKIKEWEAAECE